MPCAKGQGDLVPLKRPCSRLAVGSDSVPECPLGCVWDVSRRDGGGTDGGGGCRRGGGVRE